MTEPVRLSLSRRKGFSLQALSRATNGLPAVKVDRATKWGNPFVIGKGGVRDAAEAVDLYAKMLAGYFAIACGPEISDMRRIRQYVGRHLPELRGKNLACWCRGSSCHADVLLQIANPSKRRSAAKAVKRALSNSLPGEK